MQMQIYEVYKTHKKSIFEFRYERQKKRNFNMKTKSFRVAALSKMWRYGKANNNFHTYLLHLYTAPERHENFQMTFIKMQRLVLHKQ